jgi:hypothetical protein
METVEIKQKSRFELILVGKELLRGILTVVRSSSLSCYV